MDERSAPGTAAPQCGDTGFLSFFYICIPYIPPYDPMVNTEGILIVASELSVRAVTSAIDEPMVNSYVTGTPERNRFRSSSPPIVVVP